MSEPAADVYFNPWDEAFRANPYPHYRKLHDGPPRILKTFMSMALVARYADVTRALRDWERFSSVPYRTPLIEERVKVFGDTPRVLFSDPPVHTRLRRLVSPAFTPRRIRALEPLIRETTDRLLDKVAAKGDFEVMADLANPLPVTVIAHVLGVDTAHYESFKRWSNAVIEADNTLPGMKLPDSVGEAFAVLRSYFSEEIEKRRRKPGDDLISVLVTAHEEAEALSADELLTFVVLLLLAGNETTTNLIGNGMLALGRNPDQLALLRKEPSLMPRAIEEMLRYDSPVQSTVRYPKQDVELGGVTIPAQTLVFVIVAAANRDPAQFKDPDTFDLTRDPNYHVSFGEGIHYCLGAPLARLEGTIAISRILERFPHLRLTEPYIPTYKGSYFLRGLHALPMTIR
ncbi:MAG TPA: cytochrome P450 [Candidatus Binataceae bacterium]|nr:cytochrome P450 [Candidatus Binataceae bacterium]